MNPLVTTIKARSFLVSFNLVYRRNSAPFHQEKFDTAYGDSAFPMHGTVV